MLKKNKFSDTYKNDESESSKTSSSNSAGLEDSNLLFKSPNNRSNKLLVYTFAVFVLMGILISAYVFFNAQQVYWYYDGDNDGYGAADISVRANSQPMGYVDNAGDTNDQDECIPDKSDCFDAREDVLNILTHYYNAADKRDVKLQLEYFKYPVSSYYNSNEISRENLKKLFENYYSNIVFHSHTFEIKEDNLKFLSVTENKDSVFEATIKMVYEYKLLKDTIGVYVKDNVINTLQLQSNKKNTFIIKLSGTSGNCISIGNPCTGKSKRGGVINKDCKCSLF